MQKKGVAAMTSLKTMGLVWRLGAPRQTYVLMLPILAEIQEGKTQERKPPWSAERE